MAFYLGIDGGGSKTTCAVGDESSQLATAVAGPSNITRVGEVRARESLHQAIREACAAAKIAPQQVQRACIGVAGAGRTEVARTVRTIVAELISGEIEVVADMPIALEAAFGGGAGVIVIAGTGSFAYGRNAQGRTARAGGWGFAISDEGSAHWIGRAAVAGVLHAIDQEQDQRKDAQASATALPLFRGLKAAWKLNSLDEFVRAANSNPDFAALLPAIVAAADAGDALAQRVLSQAGGELSRLAGIVIRRLFTGQDVGSLDVWLSMAGGVFRYSTRVRGAFCDEVRKVYAQVSVNPQVVEPVTGALQMARHGHNSRLK
ncbi:MAG: ATPase, BadF/BadG/BcrA/BcrD type [Candidatus Sulfotelmatobacter sp.]|nr:ATPase, BadF/BadG/BcrA/BcrD type [Candidatus Sulfotelmatobacter sp.]